MKALSYLNKYFFKYKWHLLLGIVFIVLTNIPKVLMPDYFGQITDDLREWDGANDSESVLWFAFRAGGYYMLLALISGVFLFLTRQMIIVVSRYIEFDMKNEIYQQYQRLSYTFYRKNSTGDLMNRISEDVSYVRMYLGPGIMYTINLLVLAILIVWQMVQINGLMTIIVLIPLPIMTFIIYKVSSRINQAGLIVQKEQSSMSTMVQETFSGIRVVKAYDRQEEIEDKFGKSADAYMTKNMRLVLINALFMPTIFILVGVSTILCIYIGGMLSMTTSLTVGNILSFIFYVNMLTWPFASVGWVISLIQRAAASQERINEFLREEPEIINKTNAPFVFEKSIEFDRVSFAYPNSGIVALHDISFTLNKGEVLGVIGRTGSGKTTILQLLTRQIEPTEGEIRVDGVPLSDINLSDFLDQTGVVPQEVFLFSESIRDNIAFGCVDPKDVTEERLIEVTKAAHVYHNISDFKGGFDTLLGERGVNLSGGQKQRISISRALIRDPKILILDDCLSAVDTETEEVILGNLKQLTEVTSLIVSHRVSSIRNAQRIINLEDGKIVEAGTHEELLQLQGLYFEMYQKQLTEERKEDGELNN